jgi:hypothetical protein
VVWERPSCQPNGRDEMNRIGRVLVRMLATSLNSGTRREKRMLTRKVMVAGAAALVAAGLSAAAAPAYVLDPGGERLVQTTVRTPQVAATPTVTSSTSAKPKPRPKPPLQP